MSKTFLLALTLTIRESFETSDYRSEHFTTVPFLSITQVSDCIVQIVCLITSQGSLLSSPSEKWQWLKKQKDFSLPLFQPSPYPSAWFLIFLGEGLDGVLFWFFETTNQRVPTYGPTDNGEGKLTRGDWGVCRVHVQTESNTAQGAQVVRDSQKKKQESFSFVAKTSCAHQRETFILAFPDNLDILSRVGLLCKKLKRCAVTCLYNNPTRGSDTSFCKLTSYLSEKK